jgi:DNA-binding CsgD family transcriptional regulator
MTTDKKLDHLIGVLYETALDPGLWKEAIGLCGLYAGGVDAQLLIMCKKTETPISAILAGTVFPEQGNADFVNYYGSIDPNLKFISQGALDEWRCCHEVNNQHFIDHNEFYQDFLLAYNARYRMTGRVNEDSDQYSLFGVLRAVGQQPFGVLEQQAAQRFSGHLQRALRLQKHTQILHTKAELGARAIDALALAMLIVDGAGVILHLNGAAEYLLNNRVCGLTCKAGQLFTDHPADKNKLRHIIVEATCYPATGGTMFLNGTESFEPHHMFVTPLPAASPFAQDWQIPLALILVMKAGKVLSPLDLLGKLYDLSPAELRVASALLSGISTDEYGQQTGVSSNTVRTQLKSMFKKTGTRRQAELVAVLSRVPFLKG